jgi:hypothetical protein
VKYPPWASYSPVNPGAFVRSIKRTAYSRRKMDKTKKILAIVKKANREK